jgi:hypothetical protein
MKLIEEMRHEHIFIDVWDIKGKSAKALYIVFDLKVVCSDEKVLNCPAGTWLIDEIGISGSSKQYNFSVAEFEKRYTQNPVSEAPK